MLVLGIETSCDDTSIALLQGVENSRAKILKMESFSSEQMLAKWGGVVPELAARNHLNKLKPLIQEVLASTQTKIEAIDLIGVTTHPGLLGPLLTGINTAKTLAMGLRAPIFPVNHLFAHLEAIHLSEEIGYPYLGLLVSGGHSIFFLVESSQKFTRLGTTIDDAAGEAFDKGGKLLGLGYPAGRKIDELSKEGNRKKFSFPIGLKNSADAQMSFSGLKTSIRNLVETNPEWDLENDRELLADLCASYQGSIIDALELKTRYAMKEAISRTGKKEISLVVGGGVACNSGLRERLKEKYSSCHFVEPKFCTDNGGMIAHYAYLERDRAFPYPACLELDARSRYIDKGEGVKEQRKRKLRERTQVKK